MALVTITKAYSETLSSSTSWVINHNLGTDTPVVDSYDGSNNRIMPASVYMVRCTSWSCICSIRRI